MKNEPTLVVLIPGFPINEEDSTCLPAQQNFIKAINKDFPYVNLLILSFQYPFQKSVYYWNNNRVFAFAGKNRGGLLRLLLWLRVVKKLSRLKKENNIVGVLSFWGGECALVGERWAKKNGVKHFTWLMGQDAKKENHYIKKIRPAGSNVIAISDFTREQFQLNHGITAHHIIPIGIEPRELNGHPNQKDIDILCAGSLIPLKQYHLCAGITREIKKVFPSVRMIVCGKGPEENKIRSAILEQGLSANISLVGEKKHTELLALMKRSKVFLHPSQFEGFSGVCLEARAAGTPVISFHQPMYQDIPGWHIVDNIETMTKKTIDLLQSEPGYTPVHPFTITETTHKIMKLFGL